MISVAQKTVIDGYVSIHNIDLASLNNWWSALLLVFSNFFAIPAIIIGYIFGFYLWATIFLIAMLISIFYHLCQTTNYCLFGMSLDDWQITDHRSAGSILAMSILLFYLYRPLKNHYKQHVDYRKILIPENELEYDNNLKKSDKEKICFKCRGVNPHMLYDWQSVVIVIFYIFVIILATTAIPLTMQSWVIVIIFGVIIGGIKVVAFEEGNPNYLKERFHLPSLIFGLILVLISLVFYFIDSYYNYTIFHSLWHVFSNIGLYFVFKGTTYDLKLWFDTQTFFKNIGYRLKLFITAFKYYPCCCCYNIYYMMKKNKNNQKFNYIEDEEDDEYPRKKSKYVVEFI